MNTLMQMRPRTPAILGKNAFEEMIGSIFDDPFTAIKRSTQGYPVTDIFKDEEGNQIVEMALAGFNAEDLSVQKQDNTIVIKYEGKESCSEAEYRKIAKRSFTKTFVDFDNQLDLENAKADFKNGLLRITLPQIPEAQPKTINIICN